MTAFSIVRSRAGLAPRVYHASDSKLAVALILTEEDGSVCLFPVKFDGAPKPLTGASMAFPDEGAVRAYLQMEEPTDAELN